MKLFSKEPQIQQTEFTASQRWLEEPSLTPAEQLARAEKKTKQRKVIMISVGSIALIIAIILLMINLLSRPEPEIVEVVAPTPTPTESPILTPLLSRILEAKQRTQAIDVREAELVLPQVEFEIVLDEPKKQ